MTQSSEIPDIAKKVEATHDPDDPIFDERERVAMRMAEMFTDDYRGVTDELFAAWQEHFTDVELIELLTFMALADGFGKLVEIMGLGDAEQVCHVEV